MNEFDEAYNIISGNSKLYKDGSGVYVVLDGFYKIEIVTKAIMLGNLYKQYYLLTQMNDRDYDVCSKKITIINKIEELEHEIY